MHVVTDRGGVSAGFDAYRSVAWVLPLGWLALPFLYLPGMAAIGRRLYRFVASRRSTAACTHVPR
jgi:hypothetical protein